MEKEQNHPRKKNTTNYNNIKTSAITSQNTKNGKYSATITTRWK